MYKRNSPNSTKFFKNPLTDERNSRGFLKLQDNIWIAHFIRSELLFTGLKEFKGLKEKS